MLGRKVSLAALGPEGTFSHTLARQVTGDGEVVLFPTIGAVFAHVAAGKGDGLVPIENSEAGGVGPTLDGLQRHPIFIRAEFYVPIRLHLVSFVKKEDIDTIYAHPQAHEQCSVLLDALGVPVVHTSSNAASAGAVQSGTTAAAITTAEAAERYGIPIIAHDVQDSAENTTRFILISKERYQGEDAGKCSLLLDPKTDRAGLLADLLAVFARREINLTRIESRPSKRKMGEYVFFIDGAYGPAWAGAVAELSALAVVKEFGCYPRLEVREWR